MVAHVCVVLSFPQAHTFSKFKGREKNSKLCNLPAEKTFQRHYNFPGLMRWLVAMQSYKSSSENTYFHFCIMANIELFKSHK